MLHYILQTVAFQVFFLIIYDAFLKNETFFNWNRSYLLGTAVLSFVLPFLKFESIKAMVPEPMVIRLPEVIIGNVSPSSGQDFFLAGSEQMVEQASGFSWTYFWLLGIIIASLILVYKLAKIGSMLYKNPKRWQGDALIVFLLDSSAAFSFFHYIFLGTDISAEKKDHIVQHEMVHVKERHSLDLFILEIFRIIFWFNPLIYMYQYRLSTVHEFIADAEAVKYKCKSEYYQNLLSQVFETQQISFINPFFNQSLIKKRIIMLSKSQSKQVRLFKYALLLPLVMAMLMYTSSYAFNTEKPFPGLQEQQTNQDLNLQELTDNYYNEMVSKNESMEDAMASFEAVVGNSNNYIESIDKVAYRKAFSKYWKGKIGIASKEDSNYKTYDEYLAYKKTGAAKTAWENAALDGEVRLVVDDMSNMTAREKSKLEEIRALITNSDTQLKVTDGKTTMKMQMDNENKIKKKIGLDKTAESHGVEVPFAVIDKVPLFKGCEPSGFNEKDKDCTSQKVAMFVNENYNINIAKENGLTGKQRITVIFKIDENGKVKDVKSRAPHPALEAEAVRVIKSLPDFTPGQQNGIAVTVPYALPILFQVNEEKSNADTDANNPSTLEEIKKSEKSSIIQDIKGKRGVDKNTMEIPYAVVDEVPLFPSCENLSSRDEKKQCTSDGITKFVNKNFNHNIGKELGLTGKQRIMVVFEIGQDGSVKNIKSRAPHPKLEEEAERVVRSLPKMTPGKHNGQIVSVPYALPILIEIP